MTGLSTISYYTSRGTVYYTPGNLYLEQSAPPRLPTPPCRPRQRRPHSIHITHLPAGSVPLDLQPTPPPKEPKKEFRFIIELKKLASRENAKRVLGSVFSSFSSTASPTSSTVTPAASSTGSASPETLRSSISAASSDPAAILARRSTGGIDELTMATSALSGNSNGATPRNSVSALSRPPLVGNSSGGSPRNSIMAQEFPPMIPGQETEKPVCSGNGVSCYIMLAEPVVYLTGMDQDGTSRGSSSTSSAMLRGKLRVDVSKSTKFKSVILKFTGKAKTDWPEGIPPKKTELFEEQSLRTHVIPFFKATYVGAESGYGNMCTYTFKNRSTSSSVSSLTEPASNFHMPNVTNRTSKEVKRMSYNSVQSLQSFQNGESPFDPTPQQKGYKSFPPGVYEYSFELPIDSNCPETTKLPLASVLWQLECLVERAGTFKANLQGFKEVPVIRAPSEDSLELFEPISISRKWDDQLYYDIIVSGKSFPIGSKIPIAFKLTPLAKVEINKIKVYVTENIEYYANSRRVARKDVTRKILLFEKQADKPLAKDFASSDMRFLRGGESNADDRARRRAYALQNSPQGRAAESIPEASNNLLGDIDLGLEQCWGQTEIEMNVQLPSCETMAKDRKLRLNHNCSWKNVDVHHWIKVVMRISRQDKDDPTKRRHFEISIDSPISILNCRSTQANTALPEYSGPNTVMMDQQRVCGCPGAAATENSPASLSGSIPTLNGFNEQEPSYSENAQPALARPPQAHLPTGASVQRPIHMLRNPSFNPPPFDAEEPPPQAVTPPPLYDHVIGTPSHDGLADYFARLGEYEDEQMESDDEDVARATTRGRVNVVNPRTPGGKVARSMDIDRNFMFNTGAASRMMRPRPSADGMGMANGPSSIMS